MTEKERFKFTNISDNGNTSLFWLGKDREENKKLQFRFNLLREQTNRENANRVYKLEKENKELKTELLDVLEQLFNAESSLIHEYSTTISQDEEELREYFKQKYRKYGWKE